MHLLQHDIHVWSASLLITPEQEARLFSLLSADERERACRFRFSIHKRRFIAAHAMLRELLSLYLAVLPDAITFAYSEQKKPYLFEPASHLHFNMSHSEDLAVYAIADQPVGIDVEKITLDDRHEMAARFFSSAENAQLNSLSGFKQSSAFYQIWSRKEAILKATGTGITVPLDSFSVSIDPLSEIIHLEHTDWHLTPLLVDDQYASALAFQHPIQTISYWQLQDHIPRLLKQSSF